MKLLTRDTDYAIRALSCIAGEKGVVSVTSLTEKLDVPRPFTRKILQILNKKGILVSIKGKGGGFKLAVPPGEISLFRLMEIFQGPFEMNEHVFKGERCPYLKVCKLKKKLDKIEKGVAGELKSITLDSLIGMHEPG
ncbi:MAG: Rrf2 family transcriptional regulator [Candidatus Omnitrophica bacterium]|nr:Rrf2 family transcriptional regulator [Candidatus Omnitrophota bacterium]